MVLFSENIQLLAGQQGPLFKTFFPHILHPNCSPLAPLPQIYSSSILLRRGQDSQGCQPSMTYQVTVKLGMPHHIKAGKGNPVGAKPLLILKIKSFFFFFSFCFFETKFLCVALVGLELTL